MNIDVLKSVLPVGLVEYLDIIDFIELENISIKYELQLQQVLLMLKTPFYNNMSCFH